MSRDDLTRVCAEPGRTMFFDHVGYVFAAPPPRPMKAGTPCSICGATDLPMWPNTMKQGICLAQRTITRKRRTRETPETPALPVENTAGMGSMAVGSFAIAGPHVARIVTRIYPNLVPPPGMEVGFTTKGSTTAVVASLLRDPPKPPFVAIEFEEAATFPVLITADASLITINGTIAQRADTAELRRLAAIIERVGGPKAFNGLLELRQRLAGTRRATGKDHDGDQRAYSAMREAGLLTPAEFRSLPEPKSTTTVLLGRLMGDDNAKG